LTAANLSDPTPAYAPALLRGDRPRLLVVEDEALVRELIVLELEDAGYAVVEAEDGPTALRLLEEHGDIALLFTDIRLPGGLTGWDIAERARALRPGLPVIYTTGYSNDELRLVAGAHFLKKPYRPASVLEAIGKFGIDGRL
jgi:CheY-like chemotaxis protein